MANRMQAVSRAIMAQHFSIEGRENTRAQAGPAVAGPAALAHRDIDRHAKSQMWRAIALVDARRRLGRSLDRLAALVSDPAAHLAGAAVAGLATGIVIAVANSVPISANVATGRSRTMSARLPSPCHAAS